MEDFINSILILVFRLIYTRFSAFKFVLIVLILNISLRVADFSFTFITTPPGRLI